ncbi:unnamed protein product, partial [Protopolystoma xenopodis]
MQLNKLLSDDRARNLGASVHRRRRPPSQLGSLACIVAESGEPGKGVSAYSRGDTTDAVCEHDVTMCICPVCGFSATSPRAQDEHMELVHGETSNLALALNANTTTTTTSTGFTTTTAAASTSCSAGLGVGVGVPAVSGLDVTVTHLAGLASRQCPGHGYSPGQFISSEKSEAAPPCPPRGELNSTSSSSSSRSSSSSSGNSIGPGKAGGAQGFEGCLMDEPVGGAPGLLPPSTSTPRRRTATVNLSPGDGQAPLSRLPFETGASRSATASRSCLGAAPHRTDARSSPYETTGPAAEAGGARQLASPRHRVFVFDTASPLSLQPLMLGNTSNGNGANHPARPDGASPRRLLTHVGRASLPCARSLDVCQAGSRSATAWTSSENVYGEFEQNS